MASEALQNALDEADYFADELDLPDDVAQMAKVIIRRWSQENRLQSRPTEVTAAAAIVVACKRNNLPYTTRDVGSKMRGDYPTKYVARAETDMVTALGFDDVSVTTPEDYVDRFKEEVGVSETAADLTRQVLQLAQDGDPNLFSGRSPSAGAAAALWIGSRLAGEQVTQQMTADAAKTTTVTVRDMANSIIKAVLNTGTSLDELATTDEIDGRLNQRIQKSIEQVDAEA